MPNILDTIETHTHDADASELQEHVAKEAKLQQKLRKTEKLLKKAKKKGKGCKKLKMEVKQIKWELEFYKALRLSEQRKPVKSLSADDVFKLAPKAVDLIIAIINRLPPPKDR